jgi:hypothetical protein
VDELEQGLEPHRIMRFLDAIGAKDSNARTQSFVTSHSPVVLRELNAHQLSRICETAEGHKIISAKTDEGSQGALRSFPEAFLAKSVVLCEGASEVGFIRGLDQYFVSQGKSSISARGIYLVDTGGVSKLYKSAPTLQAMRYRVASFRDDDVAPDVEAESKFENQSGSVFKWAPGQKIEAAIIKAAAPELIVAILDAGIKFVGEDATNEHIKSASGNVADLERIQAAGASGLVSNQEVEWLIAAATTKKNSWFKTVGRMEYLARESIGPAIENMDADFRQVVGQLFAWSFDG